MIVRATTLLGILALGIGSSASRLPPLNEDGLPAPGFHHVHLNSTAPEAAIAFYARWFDSASRVTLLGAPAVRSGNVHILFTKVERPPHSEPGSAYWHFGWQVPDSRQRFERYQRGSVPLVPLFTSEKGDSVSFSSDAPFWPGNRTRSEIAATTTSPAPRRGAGYMFVGGPDGVVIEVVGDRGAERFNHVHMYQEQAFCAERWYQRHLQAGLSTTGGAGRPPANADCAVAAGEPTWLSADKRGTVRTPSAGVLFDNVEMNWYAWSGVRPPVSSRDHTIDHVGLSVSNLDAWLTKLTREGVRVLAQPYRAGDTRAFLIEGPSREQIEIVEQR